MPNISPRRRFPLALLLALLALGCDPDLGACDLEAARGRIYYDESGYPAYAGQALVEVSCGAGVFCHTSGIDPVDRMGAPLGMDFDVAVAVEHAEVEGRLRTAQHTASRMRGAIFHQVESGAMPPPPPAGETALAAGARYRAAPGTPDERPLPSIASAEGRALLRNWLACGAPVVEAVEGESQGVGDVVPRFEVTRCQDASECEARQACEAGVCVCLEGLAACDGRCIDLQRDPEHCGACGSGCGARFCVDGSCSDACPTGTTECGGACVDLTRDAAHCGACGEACGAGETCEGSVCACPSGSTRCGDTCADLTRDPAHCGACEASCGEGASCAAGVCGCGDGLAECDGACVDLASDAAHCGGCRIACGAAEGCSAGVCTDCGPRVSFAADIEPILVGSCAGSGCHSGARPASSLALTTGRAYAELVGVSASCGSAPLVTPGNVEQSYLWNKLTGVGMCSGSQMPKRGQSLPADELDPIRAWICRGAAND